MVLSSSERDRRYFDVYEYALEHGTTRQLLRQDGNNYVGRYAPDGEQVLVSRYETNMRNQLLLVNTITGESRALTPEVVEGPALHAFTAWSADKSGVYLLSNRDRQFLLLARLDLSTNEIKCFAEDNWDAQGLALTRSEEHTSDLQSPCN